MKGIFKKTYSFFLNKIWKHALRRYVTIYILIVLTSAVINWVMFSRNSTSYAISSQMNKYVERYDLLDSTINLASFHKGVKDEMPVDKRIDGLRKNLLEDNRTPLSEFEVLSSSVFIINL